MGQTGIFHHIGSFMLFSAAALLLATCISAPVVPSLAFLKVDLGIGSRLVDGPSSNVTFGTFGFCLNVAGQSAREVGYSPLAEMSFLDGAVYDATTVQTTSALTRVMVLHPVSCALNFAAFLTGAGAGVIGSFAASATALLAFGVTLFSLVVDFTSFGMVRAAIAADGSGGSAAFGAAAWTMLVSAVCSLLGMVLMFLTCCSRRFHSVVKVDPF